MGQPLRYDSPTLTQAARDISRGAWDISRIAVKIADHKEALSTPVIKFGLQLALEGCRTELYAVHGDTEQVARRVKSIAGVFFGYDFRLGDQLTDGADYDTRANGHPYEIWQPGLSGFPPAKLPGE